ncbi:MAG: mandelate racemase, partial [Betaproteobacteria bacterium]
MAEAPLFVVREIELYERPVKLRLPFRFGIVTLTECPQAFVRARVEFADGDGAWGAAAEMLAPKWFDKNPALTNEDNFDQLRDVLRMARAAYLSDVSPASAFGHFARHYDSHLRAAAAKGYNPLLANYGPALIDRAVLDALCRCRGVSFYFAMRANLPGIGRLQSAHSATAGDVWPPFAGFDFDAFLQGLVPATSIEARHTVGMLDAITADDLEGRARVGDGLPETLEEVIAVYGHRYFKLKVGGKIAADLPRLKAIATVLDRIAEPYFVTLDGNEQFDDAQGI